MTRSSSVKLVFLVSSFVLLVWTHLVQALWTLQIGVLEWAAICELEIFLFASTKLESAY